MAELLIHSMSEFSDIILAVLEQTKAQRIAEIGAEYGGMSSLLADHARDQGGHLFSIDPAPKPEFLRWAAKQAHVTHIAKPSLAALPDLADIDAWLIDGDHNWYTVYHELKAIDAACTRDAKPMLAILHDVGWPSGRRDMYYAPESIPEAFRHDYCMDSGAMPGRSDLYPGRGFRGMGSFGWAKHEGGPRNGVQCAVEDFVSEASQDETRQLAYAEIPAVFGLGLLFDMDAPWAPAVAELVLPYHNNRLLASLEQNRLANYLRVLDWQDGHVR